MSGAALIRSLAASALAASLAVAGPAGANVFADPAGRDPRVVAPRGALPAVGVVGVLDGATKRLTRSGTGFMVGPCLMVTAGHAAAPQLKSGEDLRFMVGDKANGHVLELVASGEGETGSSGDWALARVADCPGLEPTVGWLGVDLRPLAKLPGGRPLVAAASFPFERPANEMSYEAACGLRGGDPQQSLLAVDCSAVPGASGAPLFWIDPSGRPKVVALVVAVASPSPGILAEWDIDHTTIALPLADVLVRDEAARAALNADWASGANPLSGLGGGLRAPPAPPSTFP